MKTYNKITNRGYGALFSVFLCFLTILISCDDDNSVTPPSDDDNLYEILQADDDYTVLVDLIEGASLQNSLTGNAIFTVFAPTNAAFAKLPDGYLENLTASQKEAIVKYHVVDDEVRIENDEYNETIESVQGDPIFLTVNTSAASVNNSAAVSSKNVDAANGLIHKIDEILIPDAYGTITDNLKKRYEWTGLYEQLKDLDLIGMLEEEGHLTFTVPPMIVVQDIEAWLELDLTDNQVTDIWKYNMVQEDLTGIGPQSSLALETVMGDSLYLTVQTTNNYLFNGIQQVQMNEKVIESSNGTVYFLESLLVPDKMQGILTAMEKRFYLTTVRAALAVAKMTGRLYNSENNADEQFTMFIPRNNSGGINDLPLDENELSNILKYHVLLEKVSAAELQHNQTYTTWQGEELTITRNGDEIIINGMAKVKLADIEGRNGMVHVIDHVLTPSVQ